MPRPTTPAPMTMVFGRCEETASDALMTDSLHRACPARFSGSDLSRPCAQAIPRRRAAPQPHANFKPSPPAMQGFSAKPGAASHRLACRAHSTMAVNLLARFVGHPRSHALLCGTRCPHGHPPLSLEAAFGGLLFFLGGRSPFYRGKQLLLGRGIDDIAFGVDDLSSLGQAMPRHGGDAVHRTIAVECRRVVAAALPRPRLGTGAALVAGLGRSRDGKRSSICHTRGNRQTATLFRAEFFRNFGYRRAKASDARAQGAAKCG
jgi:hypothetical protein